MEEIEILITDGFIFAIVDGKTFEVGSESELKSDYMEAKERNKDNRSFEDFLQSIAERMTE